MDDGRQICQRRIHQCQGLACQCCDHYSCFLKEESHENIRNLHPEDVHILQLSQVSMILTSNLRHGGRCCCNFQMFGGKSLTPKTTAGILGGSGGGIGNNTMVMDKVSVAEVSAALHNLFPSSTEKTTTKIDVHGGKWYLLFLIFWRARFFFNFQKRRWWHQEQPQQCTWGCTTTKPSSKS